MSSELPEGFVLDEPVRAAGTGLPEGFELDIAGKYQRGELSPEAAAATDELIRRGSIQLPPTRPPAALEPGQEFLKPLSFKRALSQAVGNIPKSGAQFVEDLISPFLHPADTARAMAGLARGVGQKFIPGKQEDEEIVDALMDAMQERYGGIENIKRTLAEDPVGFVADISSIFIPGGAALGRIKTLGKVGKAVAKVGEIIEPATAAARVAKKIVQKAIPEDLPGKLYQSAAKFSTVIPEGQRAQLARTALDNRIMPTLRGLDKTRNKIGDFNTKITGLIDKATEKGAIIPIDGLFREFKTLRNAMSAEPITRGRQISGVAKQIKEFHKKKGKNALTASEAQELKQAIYRETEGYYNSLKNSPAKIEAKQAVAKAAKESIEKIFPEIKELNKREGSLIELKKQLEKSASRISNRDLLGIGVPIKGGAGGAIGGIHGMAAGLAVGLFDTPQVKAKLAIVANSLKKKGVVLPEDSLLRQIIEAVPAAIPAAARPAGKLAEMVEGETE